MRRTRTRISAVLIMAMGMGLLDVSRDAKAQSGSGPTDIWLNLWRSHPDTALEVTLINNAELHWNPNTSGLGTLELVLGAPGEPGTAELTLGPILEVGAECPVNPDCPTWVSGSVLPIETVSSMLGYAITSTYQRYGWAWQSNDPFSPSRGGLVRVDQETGVVCPVCTFYPPQGGFLEELTASRGPRTVVNPAGLELTFPADTLWGNDIFGNQRLRVFGQGGVPGIITDTEFVSDFGIQVHAVTAGPGNTLYLIYNGYPWTQRRDQPPPTLGYFDEFNVPHGLSVIAREDGDYFGLVTAMYFRPPALSGDAPELLIAADRDFEHPTAEGGLFPMDPVIYRVPLTWNGEMLAPVSALVPLEETYLVTVPELPYLTVWGLPKVRAMAQREASGDSSRRPVVSDMLTALQELIELIPCGFPSPTPCPEPGFFTGLEQVQRDLEHGEFAQARDHLIILLKGVDGCEKTGAPEITDVVLSKCPEGECGVKACQMQHAVTFQLEAALAVLNTAFLGGR